MKMKLLWELVRGFIYVFMIIYLSTVYRQEGRKELFRGFYYYMPINYIQEPPTILTECWAVCENIEFLEWDDYVKHYQKRMKPQ